MLAEALRKHEPWLEWAGKRETKPGSRSTRWPCTSTSASARRPSCRSPRGRTCSAISFADPEQEYHEAVQFYKHDVDWANRLILGD